MKRVLVAILAVVFILATIMPMAQAKNENRGGFMGFIAGCCFGIRSGAAYNDGKDLHFREWALLIPLVGIGIAIWNGIDCGGGNTTRDFARQYGSNFY